VSIFDDLDFSYPIQSHSLDLKRTVSYCNDMIKCIVIVCYQHQRKCLHSFNVIHSFSGHVNMELSSHPYEDIMSFHCTLLAHFVSSISAQLSSTLDPILAGALAALTDNSLCIVVCDGLVLIVSPVASFAPVASSPTPSVFDIPTTDLGAFAPVKVVSEMPAPVKAEPTPASGDTSAQIISDGKNGGKVDKKGKKSKGAKASMPKLTKTS
jgi:hypothetical protein